MKLISKLFIGLLFSAALTIVACGQTEEKKTGKTSGESTTLATKVEGEKITAKIGENTFILQNNEGQCQLVFNEQTINLELGWKCNFHRLPNDQVRVFPNSFYQAKNKSVPKRYRNVQIILIENSNPVEAAAKECRTELQAIKIVDEKLTKSVKMGNLAACPPFQWDEKNFTGLFE